MFDMYDIEDIILGMADIVRENRRLRHELEKAKDFEQRYYNLLNRNVDHATQSSAVLLEAIMVGALSKEKEKGKCKSFLK